MVVVVVVVVVFFGNIIVFGFEVTNNIHILGRVDVVTMVIVAN
jgi:hypothetical protein